MNLNLEGRQGKAISLRTTACLLPIKKAGPKTRLLCYKQPKTNYLQYTVLSDPVTLTVLPLALLKATVQAESVKQPPLLYTFMV